MISYIVKRFLYAIPIILGVNVITFALFFMINSPDDMARMHLGEKHITQEQITNWKHSHGYDKPLFFNSEQSGLKTFSETLFVRKSLALLTFDFGISDSGRNIGYDIRQRMGPSLALAIPSLILGVMVNITFALVMAFFRGSIIDIGGVVTCVIIMSISGLFYIIGGQYLFAKLMHLVPISGYESGWGLIRFVLLPVLIGVFSGIGAGGRWYRALFLEEIGRDYVRTARAKGLSEGRVLFTHVLKNALIPILTGIVVVLPTLFLGSLIMESFFGIPGLGSYTIEAIHTQDFAIVRAMVFLGTVLYIIGLLLTDISYTLVDPRVRL